MARQPTPPILMSRLELRATLNEWHRALPQTHPAPFPGPRAAKHVLYTWLNDVKERATARVNLHTLHWANAVLSWIPEAPRGETGFREKLLKRMREKKQRRELEQDRFWRWNNFARIFSEMCDEILRLKPIAIGAAAVGSAVLVPAACIVALGVIGFTSGGVAAGSLAAGIQSLVYGGATGGASSVLQGIGARAAFPAIVNVVAGVVGGGAAAATGSANNEGRRQTEIGDIGDDL